jgi:sugar lactone lactonase YvrE
VWVHSPGGDVLARLKTPAHPTNFGFGGEDHRTLFITMVGSVIMTRVSVPGVAPW